MNISVFLAQALGLYLVIMSIAILINASRFTAILNDIIDAPSILLFAGAFTLVLGILLILSHNLWTWDWRVIVTILAWLILIKGIIRVTFPQVDYQLIRYFAENKLAYYVSGVLTLLLGIVLCYFGFR